jgi:hypothetical protein
MYLPPNRRVSALRADIREEINKEGGGQGSGGDFYGPFWADAKAHVFGGLDLHQATRARIAANEARRNLYPQLRDGFLLWWDQRRRWTNEPFRVAEALKSVCRLPDLGAEVKIANVLCVRDARDDDHFVYPYWFPVPALEDEAGRLALAFLSRAMPRTDPEQLRVLDVIRGQSFSLDRNPLRGDEEELFQRKYEALIREWDSLRREYD